MAIESVDELILQINEVKETYLKTQNDFIIANAKGTAKMRYYLGVHNTMAKCKRDYHRIRKEGTAVFLTAPKAKQDDVIKAAEGMDLAAKGMTDMLLRIWGLKKDDPRVTDIMKNAEISERSGGF